MELDAAVAAAGVRLLVHDSVGSTNVEGLAQARAGVRGPLWITARLQTAGRGRRNRVFVSEPGNLYATLLLTDPSPPDRAAELSFVAALALHDAVVECASALGPRLRFKWPNDLLCDGAKLAGILVEGESTAGRPLATVVGIGVNCAHHPPGMAYPATDLAEAGALVTPQMLFRALARSLLERVRQWDRGNGFPTIRAAWLARAVGLGQRIRVSLPERELEGRFETLDGSGRLILRLANGNHEAVAAGDIFPLETDGALGKNPRASPFRIGPGKDRSG